MLQYEHSVCVSVYKVRITSTLHKLRSSVRVSTSYSCERSQLTGLVTVNP